jgi:hypothetical protein
MVVSVVCVLRTARATVRRQNLTVNPVSSVAVIPEIDGEDDGVKDDEERRASGDPNQAIDYFGAHATSAVVICR